jgi:hypothetical protein
LIFQSEGCASLASFRARHYLTQYKKGFCNFSFVPMANLAGLFRPSVGGFETNSGIILLSSMGDPSAHFQTPIFEEEFHAA